MTRHVRLTLLAVLSAALAWGSVGCGTDSADRANGPASEGETMNSEEAQQAVDARVKEAAETASEAGYSVPKATGTWYACGMEETAGLEYVAGGTVEGDADPVAKVAGLRDALVEEGWTLESSGDEPRPYATMSREDLTLSLIEDRQEPGRISLSVKAECAREGDETNTSVVGTETQVLPE